MTFIHDIFLILLIKIGSVNKLNRHFKYSNENQRLQSERMKKIESGVLELMKENREIKEQLVQYNFHQKMDTVDMSQFFPLKSDDDIDRFMKQDKEWTRRMKER